MPPRRSKSQSSSRVASTVASKKGSHATSGEGRPPPQRNVKKDATKLPRRRTRGRRVTSPRKEWNDEEDYSFGTIYQDDMSIKPRELVYDSTEETHHRRSSRRRGSSPLPRDSLQSLEDGNVVRKRKKESQSRAVPQSKRVKTATTKTTSVVPTNIAVVEATNPKGMAPTGGGNTSTTTINDDDDNDIPAYDRRHPENMKLVPSYAQQIYQALYIRETVEYEDMVEAGGASGTKDLWTKERRFVVDKLLQIMLIHKHDVSTLFLALRILDRYEAGTILSSRQYKVAAVVAWFLASKFNEILVAEVADLSILLSDGFGVSKPRKSVILRTEQDILQNLTYDISLATASSFLERFLYVANANSSTQKLAWYFLESTLYIHELQLKYRPSEVAAAVSIMAVMNPGVNELHPKAKRLEILNYTQLSSKRIREICSILIEDIVDPTQHETRVFLQQIGKYSTKRQLETDAKGLAAWIKFRKSKPRFTYFIPEMAHLLEKGKRTKKRSGGTHKA